MKTLQNEQKKQWRFWIEFDSAKKENLTKLVTRF